MMLSKKLNKKNKFTVKSVKEFKEKYLPNDYEEEKYLIKDPQKLGSEIGEKIYDKNKHIILGCN
jgi:hypothetical protein